MNMDQNLNSQNSENSEKEKVTTQEVKRENSLKFSSNNILKKTGKYIFEFFMLFFAVFCGFMADNWREKISEHNRELVFIHSLLEDIKSDTLESNHTLERLVARHNGIDSILTTILKTDVSTNSNALFQSWTKNMGLDAFVSNDRTIQQLKSSGELRLIRNKAVSDRIMKYDQLLKQYNTQSNMMYNALTNVSSYTLLFDFIQLNNNPNVPIPLTAEGKKILNQAYAHLFLWDRALTGLISWLRVVNVEGKNLEALIEKEYQLTVK